MVTAAGFQLKGSGWYATDFKNSGAKPKSSAPAASSESKGESKGESKSEAKTEAKTEAKSEGDKKASTTPPAALPSD
jgi:hypothetical protein